MIAKHGLARCFLQSRLRIFTCQFSSFTDEESEPSRQRSRSLLGLQLLFETRTYIPSNCDKDINQKHNLAGVRQFQKHSMWHCFKMYYLINSFLKKVKIVEAVYFANILNQSCFEFFRHQKALLNEPHPHPALVQLWGPELHTTHLVHSFNNTHRGTTRGLNTLLSSRDTKGIKTQFLDLQSKRRYKWISKQLRDKCGMCYQKKSLRFHESMWGGCQPRSVVTGSQERLSR